jgi:hypothetical protein
MASESDQLVLAARVVDQFSKPLADLKRSLRSIAAESGAAHGAAVSGEGDRWRILSS